MKKGVNIILFSVILGILLLSYAYADHEEGHIEEDISNEEEIEIEEVDDGSSLEDEDDEIFEGYENAVLDVDPGTTPDSNLYFIDEFFDRFGDDIEVREEKIAEIRAMVEVGNIEGARKALENYQITAEELEREVHPDRRDEALESAAAIRNAMRDIQEKVPPGERDEFVHEVIRREHSIATSAEIARKIRDLCRELSQLDPELFYENCRVDNEGPRWHKDLFEDLTDEQREEARKFARIMKECFETSGQECRCSEIPYKKFANTCSIAAPLAVKCEIEGNEGACEKLDNIDIPELPPHLQDVMDELERDVRGEQFEVHMPGPCRDAGISIRDINAREKCMRIMIETEAPPECRDALIEANVETEREGREICERIMMEIHAPECAERGITNAEECREFMFENNAPFECIEKDIRDPEECRRYLESIGFNHGGPGPSINFNCREIEDSSERLRCYDEAASQINDYHDVRHEDYEGPCLTEPNFDNEIRECLSSCPHCYWKPIMGDSGRGYECAIDLECGESTEDLDDDRYREEFYKEDRLSENEFNEDIADCLENQYFDPELQTCVDFDVPQESFDEDNTQDNPPEEDVDNTDNGFENVTGNVITGNAFLDYWFR